MGFAYDIALFVEHLVIDAQLKTVEFRDAHFYGDKLRKTYAQTLLAFDGKHRRYDTHGFKTVVVPSALRKKIDPRLFHPPYVVGMMCDSHLIRFVVLHRMNIILIKPHYLNNCWRIAQLNLLQSF